MLVCTWANSPSLPGLDRRRGIPDRPWSGEAFPESHLPALKPLRRDKTGLKGSRGCGRGWGVEGVKARGEWSTDGADGGTTQAYTFGSIALPGGTTKDGVHTAIWRLIEGASRGEVVGRMGRELRCSAVTSVSPSLPSWKHCWAKV